MAESKFEYEVYDDISDLNKDDRALLNKAKKVAEGAYAPYSEFYVGAVAKMANGHIVTGTNQENVSYPVGTCAERVLLGTIATLHPNKKIESIAISYLSKDKRKKIKSDHPISPCGMCRQALLEYETRLKSPFRLILGGLKGKILIIEKASLLLPFAFTTKELK